MNKKRIILVIMDGIGWSENTYGNAVAHAHTPNIDKLMAIESSLLLKAHGVAVGLPTDDDMGNSEVGHNALGCGQIYAQGAKLVNESIAEGRLFESAAWQEQIINCNNNSSTLHFIGLLSDGNVHSNISHLKEMITQAKLSGIKKVRIHVLLDGRDTPPRSALKYVQDLNDTLHKLNNNLFDARIASGGGRMVITMDRYGADWAMVEKGWDTHVLGIGRKFQSAAQAIEAYRNEFDVDDQYLPPFVISENNEPLGVIKDNDSVILFNFRGDRAIELSMAFDYDEFTMFERKRFPKVVFSGMLQYDGDLNLPRKYLVEPPEIKGTLTELLVNNGINQFAVSETQKFGHVTYFWNGNRSGKISDDLETYLEISSDQIPFNEKPQMKSTEITNAVIEALASKKYDFIRCNFPNGDMVGHTGDYKATIIAVESVDKELGRIIKAIDETDDAILIVTADHGNADNMLEKQSDGTVQIKTSHSLNPVQFIIYSPKLDFQLEQGDFGLSNVAPTIADIFGIEPFDSWEKSMLKNVFV